MSNTTQIAALVIAFLNLMVLIAALVKPGKVQVKYHELLLGLSGLVLMILVLP